MTMTAGVLRRAIVAVLVVALVGTMLLVSANRGQTRPIRTRVTLHVTDRTVRPHQKIIFFGKVKSRRAKCRRNRVVVLKRKGTGAIKRKRSDREGEFRFRIDPKPNRGRYFVVVKRKRISRPGYGYPYGYGGRRDTCLRARSRTIRIRPAPRF
jgi:hypothetical protein